MLCLNLIRTEQVKEKYQARQYLRAQNNFPQSQTAINSDPQCRQDVKSGTDPENEKWVDRKSAGYLE